MLLTAIKEMRVGKGASVNAIFAYIRTTYRYDLLKNRNHIKRALGKLLDEELVERVKGRGLAGSFKLGKKYKETKKKTTTAKSVRIGVLAEMHIVFSVTLSSIRCREFDYNCEIPSLCKPQICFSVLLMACTAFRLLLLNPLMVFDGFWFGFAAESLRRQWAQENFPKARREEGEDLL